MRFHERKFQISLNKYIFDGYFTYCLELLRYKRSNFNDIEFENHTHLRSAFYKYTQFFILNILKYQIFRFVIGASYFFIVYLV